MKSWPTPADRSSSLKGARGSGEQSRWRSARVAGVRGDGCGRRVVRWWYEIRDQADSGDQAFEVVAKNCVWAMCNRTQNAMRLVGRRRCAAGGIATAMLTEKGEIARWQISEGMTAGKADQQHLECKRVRGHNGNA